jgi:hypothetical protein
LNDVSPYEHFLPARGRLTLCRDRLGRDVEVRGWAYVI